MKKRPRMAHFLTLYVEKSDRVGHDYDSNEKDVHNCNFLFD